MDPGEISAAMDAAAAESEASSNALSESVADAGVPGMGVGGIGAQLAGLQALSSIGLGNMAVSPTQTVNQQIAALNVGSMLNAMAPMVVSMIPGASTALTLQGLLSGRGFVNPQNEVASAIFGASMGQGGTSGTGGMGSDFGGGGDVTPAVSPTLAGLSPDVFAMSGGARGEGNPPYRAPSAEGGVWSSGAGVAGTTGMYGQSDDEEEARRRRGGPPMFEEGGMVGPGGMPMVGGMPTVAGVQDQMPQADMNPQMLAMQVQQFARQNPQQMQQIRQELMSAMQSGEVQPQALNTVVQLVQVLMQSPDMYPYVRNFLLQQGIMDDEDLPPQYDPGILFLLAMVAEASKEMSGAATPVAATAPPVPSMAVGGTVPDSTKRSGGVIIEAHEGEYVIPAHIVRQKGTEFFDKLIGKDAKAERGAA